jgi:altronate dehydratase large subunit
VPAKEVAEAIASTGKPTEVITIQECRGTLRTIEQGVRIARKMVQEVATYQREEIDVSELVLGIECGGSDATSGIAANPAVGHASDLLLAAGGTAMLSETTELIGAEHVLARRAVTPEVGEKLLEIVRRCEERAKSLGVDIRGGQPTPGNIQGGVITIEEKSLGCIYKAGTAPIQGVLEYGEIPQGKGFYVMDTPGQDIESITGMLAGGAQIILFTTGRGTPTGSPIAPVIKVTGNANTFEILEDNIDLSAAGIVAGTATIQEVGEKIFAELLAVAGGKPTKAEILGHHEFGIYKIAPTF